MPIYEFECDGCGTFEVTRSMADLCPSETCPGCGAEAPRILSAFGLLRGKSQGQRTSSRGRREPGEPKVVRKGAGGEEGGGRRKTPTQARPHVHAGGHGRPWMMGH